MKIVMITHDRKIDRRIIQEAQSLMKVGYNVVIVAFPWDGNEDKEIEGIKIVRADSQNIKRGYLSLVNDVYSVLRKWLFANPKLMLAVRNFMNGHIIDLEKYFENMLLDIAVKERGDIYHAHDLPCLSSAYKAAKLNNAKLVYDSHELYCGQEFGESEISRWKKIESSLVNEADAIITINDSIAELLTEWYGCTSPTVIMNKINKDTSELGIFKNSIHKVLGLEENMPILLYQGVISTTRNLDNLVLAMNRVRNNAVLVFLGNGSAREKLIKLSKKNGLEQRVYFIDEVPQNELLKYTASADIGLIPYLGDCLNNYFCTPNKLFEFIASGTPILANDLPEINKILVGEEIGLIADFSKPETIAESIDKMLDDKSIILECKKRINQIMDKYSWNYEQKKLIDLYNKLTIAR